MRSIKNRMSALKRNLTSKIRNLKNRLHDASHKFKEDLSEIKTKPKSKRKSFLLGLLGFATTGALIFRLPFVVPLLGATRKQLIDKPNPKPAKADQILPASASASNRLPVTTDSVIAGLIEVSITVCSLALFMVL